jgi:hypothetical protein
MIKSLFDNFVLFVKNSGTIIIDPTIESMNLEPETRQQVADEYDISVNTLKHKLEIAKIDLSPGLIYPKTLKIIYQTLEFLHT